MGFLAPKNKYHQEEADLTGGVTGQAAANTQKIYGQQQQVQQNLGETAAGRGPNPAKEMLRQQTGQNVNMAAGQAASARGVNPALQARMAVDSAGQMNQQAAGQGATMQAQQSLAAQQQMMQNAQAMQQGQAGLYGTAGQMQLANTFGAGQINAGVAAQNAAMNAQMTGGVLNSLGGIGAVAMAKPPGMAGGGEVGRDGSPLLHRYMDSLASMQRPRPQGFAFGGMPEGTTPGAVGLPGPGPQPLGEPSFGQYEPAQQFAFQQPVAEGFDSGFVEPNAQSPEPIGGTEKSPGRAGGSFGEPFKGDGGMSAYNSFAKGHVPGMALAQGGPVPHTFEEDGFVPGAPEVAGDDEQNDTVPAMLSPGEVVLPRSIAQSPNAPEQAASFVAHLMRRKGSEGDGYSRVLAARQYADGGEVDEGGAPQPGRFDDLPPEARAYAYANPLFGATMQRFGYFGPETDNGLQQAEAAPEAPSAPGEYYNRSHVDQDAEGPIYHVDIGRRYAEGGQVQDPNHFVRRQVPDEVGALGTKGIAEIPDSGPLVPYIGKLEPGEKTARSKVKTKSVQKFDEGGEVEKDPSLVEAVKGWWAALGTPSEDQGRGAVNEAANAALPDSLSGRSAILAKRKREKELDEIGKDR